MSVSRRQLLRAGAAASAFAALRQIGIREAFAQASPGYGPLQPDPDGILDLPRGFSYQVLSRLGDPMTDDRATPALLDGMGAFVGAAGTTLLVRNHELSTDLADGAGVLIPRGLRYDRGRGGTRRRPSCEAARRTSS